MLVNIAVRLVVTYAVCYYIAKVNLDKMVRDKSEV